MNFDWRKASVLMEIYDGSVVFKSSKDFSIFSVNSMVLTFGCFVTVSKTAGFAR